MHLHICLYTRTKPILVPWALLVHRRVLGIWCFPLASACQLRVQNTRSAVVRVSRGLSLGYHLQGPSCNGFVALAVRAQIEERQVSTSPNITAPTLHSSHNSVTNVGLVGPGMQCLNRSLIRCLRHLLRPHFSSLICHKNIRLTFCCEI
jgi:hypothetical protein